MRVHHLENDLISLNPFDFEAMNDFFHKIQEPNIPIKAMQGGEGGLSSHPFHSLKNQCRLLNLGINLSNSEAHHSKLEDSHS